jgi:hypothetical protein
MQGIDADVCVLTKYPSDTSVAGSEAGTRRRSNRCEAEAALRLPDLPSYRRWRLLATSLP